MQTSGRTPYRLVFTAFVVARLTLTPVSADQAGRVEQAGQIDIVGPAGSGRFGRSVTALPSGNIVVTDPDYDAGTTVDVGAVYLYDGATGALISTLTGSTAGDQVGYGGVTVLSNGNYVVVSRYWDNGGATDAGAVTWGNGMTGVSGVVSLENSLVGKKTDDQVGYGRVTALSNGNYVVRSPYWSNGDTMNAGAVTWGDGTIGVSGVVSSTNSLVGSTASDRVGNEDIVALSNGNYVVRSPYWDNAEAEYAVATNAGAVTWGDGTTGTRGAVSSSNSLVGSTANDGIGNGGVTVLSSGNYVVSSPEWDNGGVANAGAATWGDGTTGISGVVSSTNSLVGSTANDRVGHGVIALSNGNYVVSSPEWDNDGVANVGAATWGNGATGTSGVVSSTNSLVGSTTDDWVGYIVTALSNGNYVVVSPYWDNSGVADAGAATWGDGTTGISGAVSSSNSLVGSTTNDQVGYDVIALSNGNYVVSSPEWDNGEVTNAGAATWGNGTTGVSGVISSTNSLVGSTADDWLGDEGPIALSVGHYVVISTFWDNGGVTDAGAVTWGDGTRGVRGPITGVYSVRGTTAGAGFGMVFAYDDTNVQLFVGRPAENTVSLLRPPTARAWVPLVLRNSAP